MNISNLKAGEKFNCYSKQFNVTNEIEFVSHDVSPLGCNLNRTIGYFKYTQRGQQSFAIWQHELDAGQYAITSLHADLVLCRVPRSHRKTGRIENALGFKPRHYFSFRTGSQFVYLNNGDFEKVKPHGVTRARIKFTIMSCWSVAIANFGKSFEPTQPYSTP